MSWLSHVRRGLRGRSFVFWTVALFLVIPLHDDRAMDPQTEFDQARLLFLRGQLEESQASADTGYRRFEKVEPEWASRFRLLEAQSMLFRGFYQDALALLAAFTPRSADGSIQELSIEAISLAHLGQFPEANETLEKADGLCAQTALDSCGDVFRAHGAIAAELGQIPDARQSFLKSLEFARAHRDPELESNAWLNLSWVSLRDNHYDEAVSWSREAYTASLSLGNQNRAQAALGNLGWAYFELGDPQRALPLFVEAEQRAARLGNFRDELRWLSQAGYVEQATGDFGRAFTSYSQALARAKQIDSKEDIIDKLEDLVHLSIQTGKLDDARKYLDQLAPMVQATGNRLDQLDVLLAQGEIAAARNQDRQAEADFHAVETDPESQTSMRLGAEHELAKLYEGRGDAGEAGRTYKTALNTFEQARGQLQHEDSKLPFLANATPIYDDYIHMLVQQGKTQEALAVADHSRARTLAQGLGLTTPVQPAALHAGEIARKADATLLFYWLGERQSYLWAVTPTQTRLVTLPPRDAITAVVERYGNALLGPDDVLRSSNEDGIALYRMLVGPASDLIRPGSNVVILGDGALTRLNFETLIVPSQRPHYWIEDATVVSAPSLYMLASAKPSPSTATGKALLLGDALSPDPDYPELHNASVEMKEIEKHFPAGDQTVFARKMATPARYMASNLEQYAYIHFVAHGVASLTDPLDSAIILSRDSATDDSFKLYAREIIQHPLHARLVTISSCYGGGTRSYAGEGLVGLSWAFLRAGAHNVIGALWEVSDDSTPALMDSLYQGLQQGLPPSIALRQAKLAMLHGQGNFRNPFFWAPFQLYTGL
jgi:CHAT domain-containing protein/Tfp pilus assembly protein PilF